MNTVLIDLTIRVLNRNTKNYTNDIKGVEQKS